MGLFQIKRILLHMALVILGKASAESNTIEGVCNWNVSSGPKVVPASVFPVRFAACRQGKLIWREPYGGVEVTFQSEVPERTRGTYEVCLTVEDSGTDIYTREGNNFKILRRFDDRNTTSEMCVRSDTKKILIYVEASYDLKTKSAVFMYKTLFKRKGDGQLRTKECKLCRQRELINSFCGGDFAVHGNVKSVIPIGDGRARGEAVVVAKKVLHQSFNIFQKSSNTQEIVGNVNFPLYCHWKKKTKHGYLFTGNMKAGKGPVIRCRIKFQLWRKLYNRNICDSMAVQKFGPGPY